MATTFLQLTNELLREFLIDPLKSHALDHSAIDAQVIKYDFIMYEYKC